MKTTKSSAGVKPVDNFVNVHKATVEVRALYDGKLANTGYTWFVWWFKYHRRYVNKKGKLCVDKHRKQGGHMVETSFVKKHGEANVKRMVIQNIVNKEKRD